MFKLTEIHPKAVRKPRAKKPKLHHPAPSASPGPVDHADGVDDDGGVWLLIV